MGPACPFRIAGVVAGHLHLTEADDRFEVGGVEGGEDAFSSDGFLGLCGLGFEEIVRDAPQG